MYSFKNDYCEGAHPKILEALARHNMTQQEGYGLDSHTLNAVRMIRDEIGDPEAGVHLISAGTQTNLLAISSFLRLHEACIAASTGHVAVHEAGAIEATGHKLITVESGDGKLMPSLIEPVLEEHCDEHMVKPRLIYISNPTEVGTVYSRKELQDLHSFSREKNLLVYADGARLGAAIASEGGGLTLRDMYMNTDAFFIGGTKTGALLGEALVLRNTDLKDEYRYLVKQKGALLAKGRVLGIQFEELFRDNLYLELAGHANRMAGILTDGLKEAGCSFYMDSPTNQIFPIFENSVIETLSEQFEFYTWAATGSRHCAVRLVTSWATPKEAVDNFIEAYRDAAE